MKNLFQLHNPTAFALFWLCKSLFFSQNTEGGKISNSRFQISEMAVIPVQNLKSEIRNQKSIDFNRQIKPILADRCFKCHGPDESKVEAGLSLVSSERATKQLKSGKRAIVPFKVQESELVRRISTTDPDDMMPTPKSNLSLNKAEKDLLIQWISEGAVYSEHWAFIPPLKNPIPMVQNKAWAKNAIDHFILEKLEEKGLKPNAPATKETLIRRLSLDLTGLPPTVEEVQNFVNDSEPNSYERLVDRLLATPQYGERMALDWLDVARYADSHGYQDDGLRNAYPYRDWVIRAFNQNLPYSEFVTWQLAGDLLPNPTRDQLIATCFNRNHQQTQEGGVVDEEYRIEYVTDRVNTFGKTFLGLTVECAKCHTHKYDPITHTEYYQMAAFFNSNKETGIIPYSGEASPTLLLVTDTAQKKLDSLRVLMQPHLEKTTISDTYKEDFKKWLATAQNTEGGYFDGKSGETRANSAQNLGKSVNQSANNIRRTSKTLQTLEANQNTEGVKNPALQYPLRNTQYELRNTNYGRLVHFNFEPAPDSLIFDQVNPPTQAELDKRAKDLEALKEAMKKDSTKKLPPPPTKYLGFLNQDTVLGTKAAILVGDKDRFPQTTEGVLGKGILFRGEAGVQLGKVVNFERNQPFSLSIWVKLLKENEKGFLFGKTNGEFEGHRGYLCYLNPDGTLSFRINHAYPANSIDLQTTDKLPVNQWTNLTMTYDGSSKAAGFQIFVNGKTPQYKVISDHLLRSILHSAKPNYANWSVAPFQLGIEFRETMQNIAMDELQIWQRELAPIEVRQIADNQPIIANLLYKKDRTAEEEQQLYTYYIRSGQNAAYSEHLKMLEILRGQENELMTSQEEVMIMEELPTPRPMHRLNRGAYDAPAEVVSVGVPAKLGKFGANFPKNRLGLAQWLLDEQNPLFARVAVNRLWQMLFGRGLVSTQEDFGNQGALPTHTELLDWLAIDFRAKNWDTKAFLKQIALSATYQQSSVPSKEAKEADFTNDLYSRYPASRLSAELMRDNALASSGLLVKKIGGASVRPYQPAGLWEALATRNAVNYVQNHGDSLYRRSMYTIWKRSSPPPAMLNFDATDRSYCVVRRQKTASPLQALVLLNDPQFVEAARILAEKAVKTTPSVSERIDYIFQALTSRKPRSTESAELLRLLERQTQHFQQNPNQAADLLKVGEFAADATLNFAEVAAYTVIASTVMNFDEFAVKR